MFLRCIDSEADVLFKLRRITGYYSLRLIIIPLTDQKTHNQGSLITISCVCVFKADPLADCPPSHSWLDPRHSALVSPVPATPPCRDASVCIKLDALGSQSKHFRRSVVRVLAIFGNRSLQKTPVKIRNGRVRVGEFRSRGCQRLRAQTCWPLQRWSVLTRSSAFSSFTATARRV